MKSLLNTEHPALVRTDFANNARWKELQRIAAEPPDPFMFSIQFVDDAAIEAKSIAEILAFIPEEYPHSFIFVADQRALEEEGFPCLVIDLLEERGRSFRTLAREMASIENNLSIANMGFEEFAEAAGAEGVFRGF